jgi:hypothetical protein
MVRMALSAVMTESLRQAAMAAVSSLWLNRSVPLLTLVV